VLVPFGPEWVVVARSEDAEDLEGEHVVVDIIFAIFLGVIFFAIFPGSRVRQPQVAFLPMARCASAPSRDHACMGPCWRHNRIFCARSFPLDGHRLALYILCILRPGHDNPLRAKQYQHPRSRILCAIRSCGFTSTSILPSHTCVSRYT
jgi:hypothetical protein